mmetsp:Transcript_25846/g.60385  ORF Transcript_25846/g.60385 Transcript_25846/m.60385 type:complete len:258 (+) Transcript_25846:514-1287(+)
MHVQDQTIVGGDVAGLSGARHDVVSISKSAHLQQRGPRLLRQVAFGHYCGIAAGEALPCQQRKSHALLDGESESLILTDVLAQQQFHIAVKLRHSLVSEKPLDQSSSIGADCKRHTRRICGDDLQRAPSSALDGIMVAGGGNKVWISLSLIHSQGMSVDVEPQRDASTSRQVLGHVDGVQAVQRPAGPIAKLPGHTGAGPCLFVRGFYNPLRGAESEGSNQNEEQQHLLLQARSSHGIMGVIEASLRGAVELRPDGP